MFTRCAVFVVSFVFGGLKKKQKGNKIKRVERKSFEKKGGKFKRGENRIFFIHVFFFQVETVDVEVPVPEEEPPAPPLLLPPFLRRPSRPSSWEADEAVLTLPPPAALAPLPAAPLPRPPSPEVEPPVATLPPLPDAPEALEGTTDTVAAAPASGERNRLAAAPADEALEPGFLLPAPAAVVVTLDAPCEDPAAAAAPGATLFRV